MKRIKIAIDPKLNALYGPEIYWTWRLLLSSIGWTWEEVPINDVDCDIAYSLEFDKAPRCRCFIKANLHLWENRSIRLESVEKSNGFEYPIYRGVRHCTPDLQDVDGCLAIARDIIFDIFWLATGQEELYWPKNKHGQFDLTGTTMRQAEVLGRALGSSLGAKLQEALINRGFPTPMPRWPNNKQAAACAGHDVDYPEVIRWLEPLRILRRQGAQGMAAALAVLKGKRDHWHFKSWIEMEKSLKIRSAFYFVARQGSLIQYASGTPDPFYDIQEKHFRELFRYISGENFEIGLHASYRAFENREKFEAEKDALEESSGQRIFGNSHHYWHLNPKDPESTLLIQQQIGLKYDTSLVHKRYVGWRRGLSWPFFPFYQKIRSQLDILQIPVVWMDDQLFGDRKDNPGNRFEILRTLADKVLQQGGCMLVDIHNYVFDDVLFPEWSNTYYELFEYIATHQDFWIDTPNHIADHWIKRYNSIIRDSKGLSNISANL